LNDPSVEVANLVEYVQCVLQRDRLAVASTEVRLKRVTEATVAVLIRTQRGKHVGPVSVIEEVDKTVPVEQPSAAEDEGSCGCEIQGRSQRKALRVPGINANPVVTNRTGAAPSLRRHSRTLAQASAKG
jgi:hypothetical protein